MTTDTIITAELLAGLTKCPFCGAGVLHCTKSETTLECGTYLRLGIRSERNRGIGCYEQENDTLCARVKELEEALRSVISEVQSVDNRTVMNRDDYWMELMAEASVACSILKKGTK